MDEELKERAINAVGKQHKIRLDPDDPVFAAVTIMDIAMQEHMKQLGLTLKLHFSTIEESNQKILADAKEFTQTVISAKIKAVIENLDGFKSGAIQEMIDTAEQNKIILETNKAHQVESNQRNLLIFGVVAIAFIFGVTIGILVF